MIVKPSFTRFYIQYYQSQRGDPALRKHIQYSLLPYFIVVNILSLRGYLWIFCQHTTGYCSTSIAGPFIELLAEYFMNNSSLLLLFIVVVCQIFCYLEIFARKSFHKHFGETFEDFHDVCIAVSDISFNQALKYNCSKICLKNVRFKNNAMKDAVWVTFCLIDIVSFTFFKCCKLLLTKFFILFYSNCFSPSH